MTGTPSWYTSAVASRLKSLSSSVVLVAVAIGAAACSSKPSTTTTSSSTPVSSTSSSTTTTTASAAACSASQLSLSGATGGASAGSSYETFTVTNNGPATCELNGYPTLTFFGPTAGGGAGAGPQLPLTTQQGGAAPTAVILKASDTAEFLVLYTDVPVNGAGCSTVASVQMAPPSSSQVVSAPISFMPCGATVKVYAFGAPGSESP